MVKVSDQEVAIFLKNKLGKIIILLYLHKLLKVELVCLTIDPTHGKHFDCFLHYSGRFASVMAHFKAYSKTI